VFLLGLAATAGAQDPRGSISGRVTDHTGGVLPGTTVTATNVSTSVSTSTTTSREGTYSIQFLNPGDYRVTVELSGFKKVVRESVEVRVADRLSLDFSMAIGQLEETVSVTAESPLL